MIATAKLRSCTSLVIVEERQGQDENGKDDKCNAVRIGEKFEYGEQVPNRVR
ncbi:hypothetical protein GCM10011352_02760 [Marinobacterium zhoushanense]|uniref:Transposase n=1 Tax=Marinobacterium zhoushanense TaxID=1679163 RepID=A0ABQ1K155_9GAMM|nr:hypothetical protein GCM10011352_02760 [Marinobacterium zhoushanense]